MKKNTLIFGHILWISLLAQEVSAIRLKGQAVTWADFNYVNYSASSMSHVYFATTGGITRYNKLEQCWEPPLTGADGLANEIPQSVWVDRFDEAVYVGADVGPSEYDRPV